MDINLNNVQHEPIIVTGSLTAALNRYYVNTANATYTDPTPVQGKGFIVYVKNGTATVGGTGYSTVGTIIYRYYHSGAWGNTVVTDPSGSYQPLDADLTSIAGLTSTSAYLRRSAANTYVLDSYSTVASNLPSTGITEKVLTGLTSTNGYILATDSILQAFQKIEGIGIENVNTAIYTGDGFSGTTVNVGQIVCGNVNNIASVQTLSLSGTGGAFALSGTGILTMPNADTSTRGLLTSTDWNTFNNKQATLVSGTNIKTINGTSLLGSGDITISGGGITIGTTTITSGTNTRILYNNSGVVGEYTLTGSGTSVAMGTSPTFTTDITTPKIIGGTGATSKITNVGSTNATPTSTAVAHEWLVGNSGGTTALTILHSGTVLLGTTTERSGSLSIPFRVGSGTNTIDFGSYSASYSAIWFNQTTPSTSNYGFLGNSSTTYLNGTSNVYFAINGTGKVAISSAGMMVGSSSNPSAILHSFGTTEQLRLGYDTSNYLAITVSSAGSVNLNAVGASAGFTFVDAVTLSDVNLILGTTTGSKIGTATSQKLGFWNATPVVQPTTGYSAATFTANSGTAVNDASTFDGYTLKQVVAALRGMGLLA